jgi:flagellar motor switch protein FliG
VAPTGKQKAAMLLMSLDAATAAELLKGLPPEDIQQVAVELARIDASGQRDSKDQAKIVQEFCESLQKS